MHVVSADELMVDDHAGLDAVDVGTACETGEYDADSEQPQNDGQLNPHGPVGTDDAVSLILVRAVGLPPLIVDPDDHADVGEDGEDDIQRATRIHRCYFLCG